MTVVVIILIFATMLVGHELAHYLMARLFGMQTPVFGIGLPYGPHWVIGNKWQTQFRIHPWLFGGYVSIPELDPEPEDSASQLLTKPYTRFAIWQRALVVLAGIAFYIVFAWSALFAGLNIVGTPVMTVAVEGLSATNPIAAKAGVKAGDHIVAVDSKQVATPEEVVSYLRAHPGTSVTVHTRRNEQPLDIPMTPDAAGKVGMRLFAFSKSPNRKVALMDSFGLATERLGTITAAIFASTGTMLSMSQQQPADNQHQARVYGRIAVLKIANDIISQDWTQLPLFVAMLCIDMAIVNLIPWPGLDGSHLLAILINNARGKPLNQRGFLRWAFIAGIVLQLLTSVSPLCLLRGQQKRGR